MGRMRQIGRYKLTHEYDKALPYLMIGAFVLPIAIGLLVSLLWPTRSTSPFSARRPGSCSP